MEIAHLHMGVIRLFSLIVVATSYNTVLQEENRASLR